MKKVLIAYINLQLRGLFIFLTKLLNRGNQKTMPGLKKDSPILINILIYFIEIDL